MRNTITSFEEILESSIDFGVLLPKGSRITLSRKLDILREKLPVNSNLDLYFNEDGEKCMNFENQNFKKKI